jgi:bifunctional UDP-N-acetylglucosamine pyrophosphorylase/glucosamine-1-phosphate N-acetyltransferase
VFEAAETIADEKPVIVIAPGEDGVPNLVGDRASYAVQADRLGTGHAAMMATAQLQGKTDQVLITYGDMPLLQAKTMQQLADLHAESGAAVTLLSIMGDAESSFGRIVRGADGGVLEIVEVSEAKQRANGKEILAIKELNAGIYCFTAPFLWQNLPNLPQRIARGGKIEYYLTDMVDIAVQQGLRVEGLVADDPNEGLGAGTRAEMVAVERAIRDRINTHWLNHSVTILDPRTTWIDSNVQIGQDTVIYPHTFLQGNTTIGEDCHIGPHAVLKNAKIEDNTIVKPFTHVEIDD